jgi:hypothetical protein
MVMPPVLHRELRAAARILGDVLAAGRLPEPRMAVVLLGVRDRRDACAGVGPGACLPSSFHGRADARGVSTAA